MPIWRPGVTWPATWARSACSRRWPRKYAPLNMLAVFLLQLVVVIMGAILPFLFLTIQTIGDPASWYYSELQLPNGPRG